MKDSAQRFLIVLLVVGGVFLIYNKKFSRQEVLQEIETLPGGSAEHEAAPAAAPESLPVAEAPAAGAVKAPAVEAKVVKPIPKSSTRPKDALQFRMEDGVAVVQGDLVVGELVGDDGSVESGWVKMPTLQLWRSSMIPYFIDPGLRDPERVVKALELFSGTVIQFVPFEDQEDVMVFQEGTGICKSYVGRVGGKQPLWIAPGCRADDIAHEILHALGFVHEQNRSDRDQFITMHAENIDEQYQENFFMLPPSLMTVSGLAAFDFDSLMIYPPTMFSKNGQPTMQPRAKDQVIRPSTGLSPRDVERVNRAYGGN